VEGVGGYELPLLGEGEIWCALGGWGWGGKDVCIVVLCCAVCYAVEQTAVRAHHAPRFRLLSGLVFRPISIDGCGLRPLPPAGEVHAFGPAQAPHRQHGHRPPLPHTRGMAHAALANRQTPTAPQGTMQRPTQQ
jgi:hypothetical protein